METKIRPYRVAKTTRGLAEAHTLLDVRFDTEDAATDYVANRMAQRAGYGARYVVVPPAKAKEVVARIKAKTLASWLQGRGASVATDFDDARPRLMKMADIADKEFARSRQTAPRKGWLKTEMGITYMFECMHLLAERRRVQYSNLTPEEVAGRTGRDEYRSSSYRDQLAEDYYKEFEAKTLEMATASLHADEY